jgi:hypothetical protein
MNTVIFKTLREVTDITAGYAFRDRIKAVSGGPVRLLQMKDISQNGDILWQNVLQTTVEKARYLDYLKLGDILFLARGNHNYAVLIDSIPYDNVIVPNHFYILRCREKSLLPAYLVWCLNQAPCQLYFNKSAEGSAAKTLRRTALEAVEIAIPNIQTQQIIIAAANNQQQQLIRLKQLIDNDTQLMNTIAHDLWHQPGEQHHDRKN